ncbi:SCO3374 family protein [Streptomyces sp. NPDC005963]|uniref:SCO3374 family protein n=1 Tax=Streptomyces sp. NPDC005963 TaxID=3156721 RepID=UPI0033EF34EF
MTFTVPAPRTPREDAPPPESEGAWARWYETELGWATTSGPSAPEVTGDGQEAVSCRNAPPCLVTPGDHGRQAPRVWLRTGVRFDVLHVPAAAGAAVLDQMQLNGPVALSGPTRDRMQLLVAAGSAEELPGLLDWLEWGGITLDLTAVGAGGRLSAPPPPGRTGSREAAVWLRPPVPGCEVEPTLPTLHPLGRGAGTGRGGGPDLVRLLDAVASECHRIRLLGTNMRTAAGTSAHEYAACEYLAD